MAPAHIGFGRPSNQTPEVDWLVASAGERGSSLPWEILSDRPRPLRIFSSRSPSSSPSCGQRRGHDWFRVSPHHTVLIAVVLWSVPRVLLLMALTTRRTFSGWNGF